MHRKAATTRSDAPCNAKAWTITLLKLRLKEVFGFPTHAKTVRETSSDDFAMRNSIKVYILASSLSLMNSTSWRLRKMWRKGCCVLWWVRPCLFSCKMHLRNNLEVWWGLKPHHLIGFLPLPPLLKRDTPLTAWYLFLRGEWCLTQILIDANVILPVYRIICYG